MTWDEIDLMIKQADEYALPPELIARQLASEGRNKYYNLFSRLYRSYQGVFLEIGCWRGCVAAHTVGQPLPNPEAIHVGIDINPVNFSHPNFLFIQADATDKTIADQVKAVSDYYGGVFCVFHDSSHHYDASCKEWELYRPLVKPGGIWVSDDVTESFKRPEDEKSMAVWFDDLPGEKKVFDTLHHGSKMGIVLC